MTPPDSEERSRSQRLQGARRTRRILGVLGAFVIAVCLGIIAFAAWRYFDLRAQRPPEQVVVIGESELEDGTKVAGLVAVLENGAGGTQITGVDTTKAIAVPGTSYDTLRDALTVGNAELVAELVTGRDADAEWLLLDEEGWSGLLGEVGGAEVDIPNTTTVFTGEELFRFPEGPLTVAGPDAAALLRGSENLEDEGKGSAVRLALAEKLGSAVVSSRDLDALLRGGNEVSDRERVEGFLARTRLDK